MKNNIRKAIILIISFAILSIGGNAFASNSSACSITDFSANPSSVTIGQSSTLSWSTNNCTSASISPNIGNVATSGTSAIYPTSTITYTLTAYDSSGSSVAQFLTVVVQQLITCSITNFNANPNVITLGQSSTLSWSTNNCTSASISPNIGNVATSGTSAIYPTSTTTYILTAYGGGGSVTSYQTVAVAQPSCSIINFSASPTSISLGGSSNLTWATNDCTSVTISNLGSVSTSGNQTVSPASTTTYTLTATGSNGTSAIQSKTVTVNQLQSCSISDFTAVPGSITSGQSATLTWSTNNCVSVNISNIGNVNPNGSQLVYPTTTTTYVLTATGSNGTSVTSSETVNVAQLSCSIINFNATPSAISSGSSATLTWATNNCTSVTISNLGSVSTSGNQTVSPTSTTTYTLTATGANGTSVTQSQTVTVSQLQNCSIANFNATPSAINSGGSATLTWTTSNCTSVTISNLGYNVPTSGTQVIYPTITTTYLLTATGSNGTLVTQSQTVTVNQVQNCSIVNFTVNGSTSTTIQSGDSVNIVWNTSNCTSANISGSNFSSSSINGSQTIYPTYSGSYILIAYGSTSVSTTQSVYVNVNNNQSSCYISDFEIDGSSSTTIQPGDDVRLFWDVTGSNCSVNVSGPNFSSSSKNGNRILYPTYSGTYTIVVYGSGSGTQTQSVYVSVDNNYQNNNCTISYFNASPTSINYGGLSTLSWSTNNCTSINISNIGSVNSVGSQTVYPTVTTTYTLSAYNSNGISITRAIQVFVNNYVAPPAPIYNTCAVTGIATNIAKNSVTLNGLVSNSYGANTYFEYGTTVGLGSQTSPKLANNNIPFSETLTGLSPNTIYFYRLVSNCNNTLSKGSIEIFQTLGNVPVATTTIIRQGTTVVGTESPIMLKIENRFQSIKVGDNVDYVVTYKNIGKKILTHPILQVILPKGITYLNSSRGTYSSDTYTLTISLEDLVPNVEGVVYLQGRVDSIDSGNAQIVTTALLVYTSSNGAQENAMAYVLNSPTGNSSLGALALFGNLFGLGVIGWLLILILILLAILLFRKVYRERRLES